MTCGSQGCFDVYQTGDHHHIVTSNSATSLTITYGKGDTLGASHPNSPWTCTCTAASCAKLVGTFKCSADFYGSTLLEIGLSNGAYTFEPACVDPACMSLDVRTCASPSPPPDFLTLQYNAYSRADSDGWHGRCAAAFHAGDFDTELRWTKLAWLNEDLLQIDASDTTYATAVSGSGKLGGELRAWGSGNYVASAQDCAFTSPSTQGEGVIDLRGTPYVIAGVDDTPCSKTCSGHCTTDASDASASVCFQWIAHGWIGTVSVTCSDGNQRCVVRCGGNAGGCKPIGNMLQLALKP